MIDVKGRFLFNRKAVVFQFEDGSELALTELLANPSAQRFLLAILGHGFQEFTDGLTGDATAAPGQPNEPELTPEVAAEVANFQAVMQENVESFQRSVEHAQAILDRKQRDINPTGSSQPKP